jgi:hypothetical protein
MTTIIRLWFIGMVVFLGCSKEQTTEPIKSLAGNYSSNVFILPDPADRPVDVQAAGGSVQISLTQNNTFNATVSIPQGVSTIMSSGTTTYSGVFSIANDTLIIDPYSFIVTIIKWNKENNSLDGYSPARGGTHVILQKK